jgi:RNA polymerase primary sigma factor
MKNFARSIPGDRHRRDRYQTGYEEMFEVTADHRSSEPEQLANQEQAVSHVNRLLDHLEPRLQRIIRMRAGLDLSEGMNLEEIAKVEGITKERVRQLCLRGMSQLRTLAKEEKIDLP